MPQYYKEQDTSTYLLDNLSHTASFSLEKPLASLCLFSKLGSVLLSLRRGNLSLWHMGCWDKEPFSGVHREAEAHAVRE